MEVILNETNFEEEVLKAQGTVLVDFWATWCGPCRMLAPIVEEIAREGKVKVCKVDVDEVPPLAIRFGVNTIPTILIFRDGELVNRSVGYREKEQLEELF